MIDTHQDLLANIETAKRDLLDAKTRLASLEALLPESSAEVAIAVEPIRPVEPTQQKSETHFQLLASGEVDYAIYLLDTNGHVISWNSDAERLKGYRRDEIIGQHFSRFFTLQDQQEGKPQRLLAIAEAEGHYEEENWRIRKDGSRFWGNIAITSLRHADGSLYGFTKVIRDLTQRKTADDYIRRLNRTLSVLSDINQSIVRIRHLPELFETACKIAVENGHFRLVWLGLNDPLTNRVTPVAHAGVVDNYLEQLQERVSSDSFGDGPAEQAIQTGKHVIVNQIAVNQSANSWRESSLSNGYQSMASFPLIVDSAVVGIFNLFAAEPDFFDEAEIRLLDEMAMDISFAITVAGKEDQRQKAEEANRHYAQRLEILREIDFGLIQAHSIQALVDVTLKHLRRLIPYQRADVMVMDESTREALVFAVTVEGDTKLGPGARVYIPPDAGVFEGYDDHHIRVFDDIRLFQDILPRARQLVSEGLLSAFSIMLRDGNRPIGSFGLFSDKPGFFTAEHREIAAQITNHFETALRQLRLSETLASQNESLLVAEASRQRYIKRLEILHEIDLGIINARAIYNIAQTAIQKIDSFFGCQQTALVLFDLGANEAVIYASRTPGQSIISQGDRFPIPVGLLEEFGSDLVQVIDDLQLLPETSYRNIRKEGMRSSLGALLMNHDTPIGMLVLNANTPGYFTAEHQVIAAEIASQLAIAIRQLRLTEELAQNIRSTQGLYEFLQTTLDAFPANTAVLAPDGAILTVNLPWQRFAQENGATATLLGTNYLDICDSAGGPMSDESGSAAAGIRGVIDGRLNEFNLEYPCHSPTEERWFIMRVTPFAEPVPRRVVVAHINITERKIAEKDEREQRLLAEALRDSLATLTTAANIETIMVQILAYSASVIPSEAGAIILFEGDQGRMAYSRGFSVEANLFFENYRFSLDSGIYGRSAEANSGYLVSDTRSVTDWTSIPVTDWIHSSVAVPIVLSNEQIGLLVADSATPNRFKQKDLENLQTFARYAALALENARHVDQLEQRVKHRTAQLQATTERVEAILNNSVDGILLLNAEFQIQQANAAFVRLFSCEADDYIGDPVFTLIDEAVRDHVSATLQDTIARGANTRFETRAKDKNGKTFDAEIGIGLIKNDGLVLTIQDITERKAQERQLQYHAILQNNVSDAVIVTDMTFYIQSWNKAAERIYGWTSEEAVGALLGQLLNTQYPSPDYLENAVKELNERGWIQGDITETHKDGSIRYISTSITLVKDEHGNSFGLVRVNRDITARKRIENELAEQRNLLRTLINTIPYRIYIKDILHHFILSNQANAMGFGYRNPDELINKSDFDYFPAEIAEQFRAGEAEILSTGKPMIDHEDFATGADGFMWTSSTKFPLRNLNGEVIGLVGITRDITEQKKNEETLRKALEKEKELNELKSRFVSMASHEFRTPLATIHAATETLSAYRQRMTEDQIDLRLEKIRHQVDYLKGIMDDVLLLARLQARQSDFNPVVVNLDELCRNIIDEFQSRPDITHKILYMCNNPVRILILDVKLIRQIISNLITNAIKYSPQTESITVKLEYAQTLVSLSVSDQGIGIPEADLKHLFEPFHRATNVGTISGTGLGLVIMKEAVDRHNGTITVESQVGMGTTFNVNIPISADLDVQTLSTF
jgi:PAS domain S-box-containing protein